MVPVGRVVARPDGPNCLTARKEGSAQHKGPVAVAAIHRPTPFLQALNPKQSFALLYTGSGQASAQVSCLKDVRCSNVQFSVDA